MSKKRTITVAAATAATAAIAATLLVPALAGGHATVSTLQPQGKALTAARTTYVLRVPNETADTNTWRVKLAVPEGVREAISFKATPGWKTKLNVRDTGKKDDEGAPIEEVVSVTYTAKTRDDEIAPHFFGEFLLRFQNPATPVKLCFPTNQFYGKANKKRKGGEVVRWVGPTEAEFPASCLNIEEAPPTA